MITPRPAGRPRPGFITAANGWTHAALLHLDPWDAARDVDGGATVATRLVDPRFVPPVCAP